MTNVIWRNDMVYSLVYYNWIAQGKATDPDNLEGNKEIYIF